MYLRNQLFHFYLRMHHHNVEADFVYCHELNLLLIEFRLICSTGGGENVRANCMVENNAAVLKNVLRYTKGAAISTERIQLVFNELATKHVMHHIPSPNSDPDFRRNPYPPPLPYLGSMETHRVVWTIGLCPTSTRFTPWWDRRHWASFRITRRPRRQTRTDSTPEARRSGAVVLVVRDRDDSLLKLPSKLLLFFS